MPEWETNEAGYALSRCKACSGLVFFAETLAGRRLMVDAEPSPDGNIAIESRGSSSDQRLVAHVFSGPNLRGMRNRGAALYEEHDATCPDVERP